MMERPTRREQPAAVPLSAVVLGAVVLVTAIAPLATDMYVPAFPLVGRDLSASPTQVQLTLTTFFVGMALGQLVGAAGVVLRNRQFVAWLLVFGLSMGVIFAYVATSAFVLQSMNGLSPLTYSLDFAANAVGLTVTTLVAARLAGRASTRSMIAV